MFLFGEGRLLLGTIVSEARDKKKTQTLYHFTYIQQENYQGMK